MYTHYTPLLQLLILLVSNVSFELVAACSLLADLSSLELEELLPTDDILFFCRGGNGMILASTLLADCVWSVEDSPSLHSR